MNVERKACRSACEMDELLVELADALANPTFDNRDRKEHFDRLEAAMAYAPDDLRETLEQVRRQLADDIRRNWFDFLAQDFGPSREQMVTALAGHIRHGGYLYHGTIYRNLERIAEDGLIPDARRVWQDVQVDRSALDAPVFFETTWRGATDWAIAAAARARGPKGSRSRQPVVLRVPRAGLTINKDPLSAKPGSVWVKGPVSVSGAGVLGEPFSGFPSWKPLAEVLPVSRQPQS